jgi:hypothetical protein
VLFFGERGRTVSFLIHPVCGNDQVMWTDVSAKLAIFAQFSVDLDVPGRQLFLLRILNRIMVFRTVCQARDLDLALLSL